MGHLLVNPYAPSGRWIGLALALSISAMVMTHQPTSVAAADFVQHGTVSDQAEPVGNDIAEIMKHSLKHGPDQSIPGSQAALSPDAVAIRRPSGLLSKVQCLVGEFLREFQRPVSRDVFFHAA